MEEFLKALASRVALGIEMVVVLIILTGVVLTLPKLLRQAARGLPTGARSGVYLGLGRWLVLGLEFALAADIVRTAIAPTWTDIGQLAAIAGVRTFLNYFLTRDLEALQADKEVAAHG